MSSVTSLSKNFQLPLQPAPAWTAILGFILLSVLLIVAGSGKILNLAFPSGAFCLGIFLYLRYPILYIGFTWWILFLTPFVRRLADYQSGFTQPSPILLAPYLVILATLITLWKNLPRAHRQGGIPFVLSLIGVGYGFLVGLIQNPPLTVGISLLDWLTPLLLSFHLFVNWRDYPSYRQNIQRVFLWGVLVTGAYGIVQYIIAPDWDRYWRIKTEMVTVGIPEPFAFNVFSTMNSNGPFSTVMMAGLLLLVSSQGFLRFPATAVGFLAFLLSNVRSAWMGYTLGLLTLGTSIKPKQQMYLMVTVVVIALLIVPLATMDPFADKISARMSTFSNLEEDGSGQARTRDFQHFIGLALVEFVGKGIGSASFDNAFLIWLFHLGWMGTIPYVSGMLLLLLKMFKGSKKSYADPFAATARSIFLVIFAQLIMGPIMVELPGIVFWSFGSLFMAADKYYQAQHQSLPHSKRYSIS